MKYDAITIKQSDNVATALHVLNKQDKAIVDSGGGPIEVIIGDPIPYGHKFAIQHISKGEHVIKYGEVIGKATIDIQPGVYVHIHNIESLRGRGDLQSLEESGTGRID